MFRDASEVLTRPFAPAGPAEAGEVRLETARLALRRFRADDFPAYFQMLGDPAAFRFSRRRPLTSEQAWRRLLWNLGHWSLLGYGLLAVEEKESGRLAGEIGHADFRRRLGPDFDAWPEASWTIAGWAQGQGYATEACSAALAWLERRLRVARTVCLVDPDDGDSLALARRLGYLPFGERLHRRRLVQLHARLGPLGRA